MRKLLFSNGSPFGRRVRIVLAEMGLEYEPDILDAIRPVEQIKQHNPALQVPVLYDGERHLFGSNLIVQYLLATYPTDQLRRPPMSATMTRAERHWDDKQILTAIETVSDAMVNIRLLEGVSRESVPYVGRQEVRIASCIDWLEQRIHSDGFWPGTFSIMDIYLICPLLWGKQRGIFDYQRTSWPRVNAMISQWKHRESILATPIKAPAAALPGS